MSKTKIYWIEFFDSAKKTYRMNKNRQEAGVITGTVRDGEIWVPEASKDLIPLTFLKRVGIFEIPPPRFDQLTLTAQHLSFVEFFASVGILRNLDIKGSLSINYYLSFQTSIFKIFSHL